MLFTEFNIDDAKEVWQEEAFEDGHQKGITEGIRLAERKAERKLVESAKKLISIGTPPKQVVEVLGLPLDIVLGLKK